MPKSDDLKLSRRNFINCASTFTLGTCFLGVAPLVRAQGTKELPEELSPEEKKIVEDSVMAQDINNYFGKGYSCAESILMVSLRFLKKPEELVWAASGFGGGMYHKDLCGFLTGGLMAIGIKAGTLKKAREEKKEICKNLVNQYWTWWTSLAPLHCSDIRKKGTSRLVCRRLGFLATAKIEELIK
jgi:C_GCAxxG_C_C family probable redox protein